MVNSYRQTTKNAILIDMNYSTIIPNTSVQTVVECYWFVSGTDTEEQKIIPDGFPEIIFHFGDAYELRDPNGSAVLQEKILVSGQLSKPILLKPTGISDVFGIKFKPAGIWKLLGIDMSTIKDEVIAFTHQPGLVELYRELESLSAEERVRTTEAFISSKIAYVDSDETDSVLSTIHASQGNVSIDDICEQHHITPRTLQRIFQHRIGVTAKQYARIVRFKTVYSLLQKPSLTKSDSVFLSGYFDQPHFNREFREFTQENPAKWFGDNHTFSNFFMNRDS